MRDKCPKCEQLSMPTWHKESRSENARMCQNPDCKYIEEKTK